ncbi:MAG: hypothetical protein M3680_14895 [Myxococcota bacterium]|nr:hypothetical protein [Myxococcota bacterium]
MVKQVAGGFTVVAVVVGWLLADVAHADDESDRKDLLSTIDSRVRSMSSELDGFSADADGGDLDDAIAYAREVRDLVSRLERVNGSDSRANEIVSRYPGYLDSFREAAPYVKRLKLDREMASAASSARFSASDSNGYFGAVASELVDAVSEMGAYWRRAFEAASQGACSRLAQGERHPDIEKALETLSKHGASTKATVTQLKKDYNQWLRNVRKLREFSVKDRDEIRDLMCRTGGEYEMERRVTEVADRWASQIASEYGTALGVGDRLRDRAAESRLSKFKGSQQVLEGLRANFENLAKLKNHELRGSNNPKIRTKLEYGKSKHRDLQSSLCGSGYAELKISSSHCSNAIRPGSGCIADCVLPGSTCMVVEIKPDSDQAKDEGNRQRAAYADGLRRWYRSNKVELFKEHPKLQACEDSGQQQLNVDSKLEIYEFCPRSSAELTEDPMTDVSSDVSESE